MGDEDTDISISGKQLCQYLDAADSKVERALGKQSLSKDIKRRKRSGTPPEDIRAGDEAKYAEQEERAAKRVDHDWISMRNYQPKTSQTRIPNMLRSADVLEGQEANPGSSRPNRLPVTTARKL